VKGSSVKSYTHILDTNIVSDLIRSPNGFIREKIEALGVSAVCINIIIAAEIRFGCAKRGSPRLTKQANAILAVLPIVPLEEPVDLVYGDVRQQLETQGQVIGPNDLLIAAHAKQLDLTLVTANEEEFKRVADLRVENWLGV
jgi:tRNA(fMet)-specific endonuclease VapC